jgi:FMN phosphatase YigB (HAD superfamily)
MIRSIIFDIYGTLIDIKSDETIDNPLWKNLLKPYKLSGELPTQNILREFYLKSCDIEMKKYNSKYPDIEIREVFKKIVHKFLHVKYHNDSYFVDELTWEFRKLSTIELTLREGATKLLQTLKEKEYLLGIISNTQDGFTWGELENFKINSEGLEFEI